MSAVGWEDWLLGASVLVGVGWQLQQGEFPLSDMTAVFVQEANYVRWNTPKYVHFETATFHFIVAEYEWSRREWDEYSSREALLPDCPRPGLIIKLRFFLLNEKLSDKKRMMNDISLKRNLLVQICTSVLNLTSGHAI